MMMARSISMKNQRINALLSRPAPGIPSSYQYQALSIPQSLDLESWLALIRILIYCWRNYQLSMILG